MKITVKTRTTLTLPHPEGYVTIDKDGEYANHETYPRPDSDSWYSYNYYYLGSLMLDEKPTNKPWIECIWDAKDFIKKYEIK